MPGGLVDEAVATADALLVAGTVVVGTATYGKGTVGIASLLPNGSLRTRQLGGFVTPAGRTIDRVGVQPDVRIRSDARPRPRLPGRTRS